MVKLMKPYKVLIVEDEAKYTHLLQDALVTHAKRKFEVLALTNNLADAWRLINDKSPDAVIVNLQLEKSDGLDLLEKIRKQADDLTVVPYTIAIASSTSKKVINAAKKLADYFYKKDEELITEFLVEHLELMSKRFGKSVKNDMDKAFLELEKKQRKIMALQEAKLTANLLREQVGRELDTYYMSHAGKGRTYLIEAISIVATSPDRDIIKIRDVYNEMIDIFGVEMKSIEGTMRRTIKRLYEADSKYMITKYGSDSQGDETKEEIPTNKDFVIRIADKVKPK